MIIKAYRLKIKNLKIIKVIFKITVIIFAITVVFSILSLVILASFIKSKISKINYEHLEDIDLGNSAPIYEEELKISENEFREVKNILLLGIDSRDTKNMYNNSRTDSIIIFSINPIKKSIKLVSIPRDTYVEIPGRGKGKINTSFAKGEEELTIKTLNQNFEINISEYITIDFSGLVKVIDKLGGIELEITEDEMKFINKAVDYTAKVSNGDNSKLINFGRVHLNGTQVLTHCRNRSIGNYDFERTERQRDVIEKVIEKVLEKDFKEINYLIDLFLPCVTTNIDFSEYIKYIPILLKNKNDYRDDIISCQVPSLEYGSGKKIDGVYYFVADMEKAKQEMREFLYKK